MPELVVVASDASVWSGPAHPSYLQNGGWAWVSSEFKYNVGVACGGSSVVEFIALQAAYNAHKDRLGQNIEFLVLVSDSENALGRLVKENDLPDTVVCVWVKGHRDFYLNCAADYLAKYTRLSGTYEHNDVPEGVREKIMKYVHKHHTVEFDSPDDL